VVNETLILKFKFCDKNPGLLVAATFKSKFIKNEQSEDVFNGINSCWNYSNVIPMQLQKGS
jgi:hypothetical protein